MPLEKGQAPLEKGQTYIEHFPAREDALLISESGCVPPEVMVLNTNPLVLFTISQVILIPYGQILNQTVLRRPPGIQARQGNSQNHLKGSEGFEGNHPHKGSSTIGGDLFLFAPHSSTFPLEKGENTAFI